MCHHNHYLLTEVVQKVTKEHFQPSKKTTCVFFTEQQKFKALGRTTICNLFQQKQTQLHVLNNCPF